MQRRAAAGRAWGLLLCHRGGERGPLLASTCRPLWLAWEPRNSQVPGASCGSPCHLGVARAAGLQVSGVGRLEGSAPGHPLRVASWGCSCLVWPVGALRAQHFSALPASLRSRRCNKRVAALAPLTTGRGRASVCLPGHALSLRGGVGVFWRVTPRGCSRAQTTSSIRCHFHLHAAYRNGWG